MFQRNRTHYSFIIHLHQKSIRSDDNAVFIRVFNFTSRKATPLDKQYTESMVPHESSSPVDLGLNPEKIRRKLILDHWKADFS